MLAKTDLQHCDFISLNFSFEKGYFLEFEYEPYGRMHVEFDHAWFYRQIKCQNSVSERGVFDVHGDSLLNLVYERSYETLPLNLAKHFRIVLSDWLIDFIVSVSPSFRTDGNEGQLKEIATCLIQDDHVSRFISGAIQYDKSEKYDASEDVISSIKAPIEVRSVVLKNGLKMKLSCEKANEIYYELSANSPKCVQIMDELLFNTSLGKMRNAKSFVGPVYQINNSILLDEIIGYRDTGFQYRVQGANDTVDIVTDSVLTTKRLR